MPTITPDTQFQIGAAFKEQVGDSAFIVIHGIRVYDIEVNFLLNAPLRQAILISHGFCSAIEQLDDFIDFTTFLVGLPIVIPSGYSLPITGFMTSPFVNLEYHTFEADYFLYRIRQKPFIHIETGIDFALSLWAQVCVDCVLEYRKLPFKAPPLPIPLSHERIVQDNGFTVDFPAKNVYIFGDTGIDVFARYTQQSGNYDTFYTLYPDCSRFWSKFLYTEEQQASSVWFNANGIKTDSTGRVYYWGTDASGYEDFPLRNIEPIPQSDDYLTTTYGSQSVNGLLRAWNAPGGEYLDIYPPNGVDEPVAVQPPYIPIIDRVNKIVGNAKIFFNPNWSHKIDGSWRIGYGGYKI